MGSPNGTLAALAGSPSKAAAAFFKSSWCYQKVFFRSARKETLVWSSPSISVAAKLLKFASLNIFRNADASESITGLEINQSDLFL